MKKLSLLALTAVILAGCKPTEENYKTAYETAAQKKAEAYISDQGGMMDSLDGPRREIIGNDTILVSPTSLKPLDSVESRDKGGVGVAVAAYKMKANARAHADNLRDKYPEAFVASDGREMYYVIIDRCKSVSLAPAIINRFEKENPDYNYIGLPYHPVAAVIFD